MNLLRDAEAQAAAVVETSVVSNWPADPDEALHEIVLDLDQVAELKVFAAEFDDYGSGYASFVEVKLTRRDDSLVVAHDGGVETRGFGVLLSRLAPVAVMQNEAAQWKSDRSGSETIPGPEKLVACPIPGFPESSGVADLLLRHGYEIAEPELLRESIATGLIPSTILSDGPWTAFDAWFHWCD